MAYRRVAWSGTHRRLNGGMNARIEKVVILAALN
jgi:hypothetical protein